MIARLLFAAVAAAGLLSGIYAAGKRGLADMDDYPARRALAQWGSEKRAPGETEWRTARSALERAGALAPSNPLYVEEMGRLLELRAAGMDRADPAARALLEQSRAQFRQAVAMRPGSPYAWSSLALVKFRLNEMDYEFYGALERAARYGPWEPAVQLTLADIGLAGWMLLALPGKQQVLGALERGMLRQDKEILRLAAFHRTLPLLCADPLLRTRPLPGLCPPG
ncbi:MAG TPA: hypothetical protein VMJ14_05630 [Burkholderiales bacterium]|nr:hypothetical protein [Burkholderiales bacterium]